MRVALALSAAFLVAIAGPPALAVESLVLYDDFNATTINPNKWFGVEGNPFGPLDAITTGFGTDARRFLQGGRLRMFYRAYANTTSSTDSISSSLRLHFINPAVVTAMKATVAVGRFELVGCPANTSIVTTTRARLQGVFFNAGVPIPGAFTNDVFARVAVQRRVDSIDGPGIFRIRALTFRCIDPACNFTEDLPVVELGLLAAGAPGMVSVTWDPDNNQFIYGFGATTIAQAYPWSDGAPPGVQIKRLDIQNIVPNCTSAPRPTAAMDVSFDDVFVNASGAAAATARAPGTRRVLQGPAAHER